MATDLSRPTSDPISMSGLSTLAGPDAAYFLLRTVFTIAPIAFGLDKVRGGDDLRLAQVPGSRVQRPDSRQRTGRDAHGRCHRDRRRTRGRRDAALWRTARGGLAGGDLVSLLLVGGYADIALRDFGLLVGALALSRLASAHAVRA